MAVELRRAIDYYINEFMSKIPNRRIELVREKMLTSKWISCEEQKPPSEKRILAKYKDGSVCLGWFYGFKGDEILKITHWKPLLS